MSEFRLLYWLTSWRCEAPQEPESHVIICPVGDPIFYLIFQYFGTPLAVVFAANEPDTRNLC